MNKDEKKKLVDNIVASVALIFLCLGWALWVGEKVTKIKIISEIRHETKQDVDFANDIKSVAKKNIELEDSLCRYKSYLELAEKNYGIRVVSEKKGETVYYSVASERLDSALILLDKYRDSIEYQGNGVWTVK